MYILNFMFTLFSFCFIIFFLIAQTTIRKIILFEKIVMYVNIILEKWMHNFYVGKNVVDLKCANWNAYLKTNFYSTENLYLIKEL